MTKINDYLIDQSGKDWKALLSAWLPILPSRFTLWLVNRLGDVIVVAEDGSVHFLDIGGGSLTEVAADRQDFADRLQEGDNATIWLATSLVDECAAAGMTLEDNQCYSYRVPPFLGGEFAVSNLEPADLSVHYGLLGQIWRKVKDLPEGTPVGNFTIDG